MAAVLRLTMTLFQSARASLAGDADCAAAVETRTGIAAAAMNVFSMG